MNRTDTLRLLNRVTEHLREYTQARSVEFQAGFIQVDPRLEALYNAIRVLKVVVEDLVKDGDELQKQKDPAPGGAGPKSR